MMKPDSQLKKKLHSVTYKAHEMQASGVIHITKEDRETNQSHILMKLVPGPRLKELVVRLLKVAWQG